MFLLKNYNLKANCSGISMHKHVAENVNYIEEEINCATDYNPLILIVYLFLFFQYLLILYFIVIVFLLLSFLKIIFWFLVILPLYYTLVLMRLKTFHYFIVCSQLAAICYTFHLMSKFIERL